MSQGKAKLASRSTKTTSEAETNLSRNATVTSLLLKASSWTSSSTDARADSSLSYSNSSVDADLSDSLRIVCAFRLSKLATRSAFSHAIQSIRSSIDRLATASAASCWSTALRSVAGICKIVLAEPYSRELRS